MLRSQTTSGRSAYAYGELPPSRLDLCKERYGGPFTTVQIEDVKSFLYILSIVLATFGYGFVDTKLNISDQYLIHMRKDGPNNFIKKLLLIYPLTIYSMSFYCVCCSYPSIHNSSLLI